ncbi:MULTISPECIES: nucleotidyltransferase family protein [unclassified Methanoregula]|uniref:nucleotidyltransferase family protein n=1 Tax=unclassified Methanoregula TaxID=2649730 RepID=UPI0009D5539B|nr:MULTISPECIES: nucleotidyltransferase domain-containing protein [unclassified Methanoregula]OPX62192.1 MAG: Nucleotidyltransferase domain protein [Methanoregula sp. PtaB.Bin085]OPY35599.1 MAG: Nucleotidyltransferase domain protein [Methanoregula sp. PtaU1.Bin006]
MNALIRSRKKQIEAFCKEWNIRELQVFGSVTTNNFGPQSDIDIVVDFPKGSRHTLIQLARMEEDLERIFGRRVDLLTRQAVEQSRNYIRKKSILASLEKVYGA